jgi:hypothetical protein
MTVRIKAYCGCKQFIQTDNVITPTEVIRWAEAHAYDNRHTVMIQGEVRVQKRKEVVFDHKRK